MVSKLALNGGDAGQSGALRSGRVPPDWRHAGGRCNAFATYWAPLVMSFLRLASMPMVRLVPQFTVQSLSP